MNRILLIIVVIAILSGCAKSDEFNFSLSYGIRSLDKVSTYDNSLIVDTIDGAKKITFHFTDDELTVIKNFIEDNGIMDESYEDIPNYINVSPNGEFNLTITYNGQEKVIYWDTGMVMSVSSLEILSVEECNVLPKEGYESEFEKLQILTELEQMIEDMIYEKEEVKTLPQHRKYI